MRCLLLPLFVTCLAPVALTQNLVFNGDFEAGGLLWKPGWSLVKHLDPDPNGKHGFRVAPVKAGNPDDGLYTYFGKDDKWHMGKICVYRGQPFFAEAKQYPLTFNYMWEKTYSFTPWARLDHFIDVRILDGATKTTISTASAPMKTTALIERGNWNGIAAIPRPGSYYLEVWMVCAVSQRGDRYYVHVDDIVIGKKGGLLNGQLSAPQRIDLTLDSPGDAGLTYALASSLGTGPIPIGNRILGLSPDPLFFATAQNSLPGIFQQYRGKLDSKGKASATIAYPRDKRLLGVKIHSAFIVLHNQAKFGVMSISNTYSFTIK